MQLKELYICIKFKMVLLVGVLGPTDGEQAGFHLAAGEHCGEYSPGQPRLLDG